MTKSQNIFHVNSYNNSYFFWKVQQKTLGDNVQNYFCENNENDSYYMLPHETVPFYKKS